MSQVFVHEPSPLFEPDKCSTHSASPAVLTLPPGAVTEHDPYHLIDPDHLNARYRPPEPSELATTFRHSHWAAARERARRAMVDADYPLARRFSFQTCGGNPLVEIDVITDEVRVRARCCHDRWCRACGQTRRRRLARSLTQLAGDKRTLAVVLTPKSTDAPLGEQLTDLLAAFARLRKNPWWKKRVQGGAWVFEVTYNDKTRQWHPHLHTLVHAEWLEKNELGSAWYKATGDSYIIDVSLVSRATNAIAEVTKYVGKITHRSWEHEHELLVHAMIELNGRRLCSTFGNWKEVELQPDNDDIETRHWISWGSIENLWRLKEAGDPKALAVHKALITGHPIGDPDLAWEIVADAQLRTYPGPAPPHELMTAACGA